MTASRMITDGRNVPTLTSASYPSVAVSIVNGPLDRRSTQHRHDERLVVHDEQTRARAGAERIGRPPLSDEEALELVEVDAAVAARREVGAEGAGADPPPKRGDRDPAVRGRLAGGQVRAAPGRRAFHFLHI